MIMHSSHRQLVNPKGIASFSLGLPALSKNALASSRPWYSEAPKKRDLQRLERASYRGMCRSFNPKGIASSSPGLPALSKSALADFRPPYSDAHRSERAGYHRICVSFNPKGIASSSPGLPALSKNALA